MKLERHKNKETKLDDAANNNYTLQQDYYLVGAMILFLKEINIKLNKTLNV